MPPCVPHIYHLAPSIHPALLGAFALLATLRLGRRPVATLALCAGLLFTGKVIVPNTESWGSWVRPKPYLVSYRVGGDTLQLPRTQANYLRWLESTIRQNLEPEENILILPVFVTLYPLLGKESPIRGLYLTRPASNEEQAEIIRSLEEKGVNWALIINLKIDGREDLLFESTHPLVWEYLEKGFRRHLVPEISPPHIFYQRRGFSQSDPVRVAPATLSRSLGSSLPSAMLTARK